MSRTRPPWPCRTLLAVAAWLVPGGWRRDWRREWDAEIAWRVSEGRCRGLTVRAAGAVWHALWLRWNCWRPEMWTYDLRIAARTLLRQPAFLALAVLTLGLGVGATAAVFSAVRAVILRPLPYPAPDQLIAITTTSLDRPGRGAASSPSDVIDWATRQRTLTGLAAFTADALAISGPRAPAEQVPGASVTGAFFDVLGVQAARGRMIDEGDARAGAAPVVVLSDRLWQRRFAGDPAILGASIVVDGVARDVVGILAPGLTYPLGAEAWVPLAFTAEELATQRGAQYLDVIGRLRADSTLAAARADLDAIANRLAAAYPRTNEGRGVQLLPLRASLVGDVRPGLLLLLSAAMVVLLVVCANVAGLLLTRALARSRELAIRSALGAARGRLVRAALVEAALIAAAGSTAGLGVAWAAARRIAAADTLAVPFIEQTRLDATVVLVVIAAAVVSALLVGVAPAWRAPGLADLANRARAGAAATARGRGRAGLVVIEIALAVVLVIGAVTLVRSFARLVAVDVGFETSDRIQTFAVSLPEARYDTPASRAQFVDRLLTRVRQLPGAERAGGVFGLPLTGFGYRISVSERDGVRLPDTAQDMLLLSVRVVTPDYLATIGLPVRRGRAIDATDGASSPRVALVNEAAAQLLWPDTDALDHTVRVGTRLGQEGERVGGRIVGVVADSRERGPMSTPLPTIYVAHAQFPVGFIAVTLRTAAAGGPDVPMLRSVLGDLDPDVPMFRVRTMAQLASSAVAQPQLLTLLMSLFGVAVLGVAALGLYGSLAQAVEARRKEIGIRRAIGATVGDVVRLVAWDTTRLVAAGLAVGVVAAAAFSELFSRVAATADRPDAVTVGAAVVVFAVVAAVAALVPCQRALAVDPAVTLKAE
ncbi:MAG: ADOP family duplicated permease [Vicinamibacterales bacterium]